MLSDNELIGSESEFTEDLIDSKTKDTDVNNSANPNNPHNLNSPNNVRCVRSEAKTAQGPQQDEDDDEQDMFHIILPYRSDHDPDHDSPGEYITPIRERNQRATSIRIPQSLPLLLPPTPLSLPRALVR